MASLASIEGNGTGMPSTGIAYAGAHGELHQDSGNFSYTESTQTLSVANVTATGSLVQPAATDIAWVAPLGDMLVSSGDTCTLTRGAEGNWYYAITSTGATTYFAACPPNLKTTSGKGWKITGVNVSYALGVANATSITPVFDSVAYVNGASPAVTATFGGTIAYDTNHNTAQKRYTYNTPADGEHTMNLTLGTPVYFNTLSAVPVFELQAVLANTGTFKLRQIEFLITNQS